MSLTQNASVIHRFWFEPSSPSCICIFRILFGIFALLDASFLVPDFLTWYGKCGVAPEELMRQMQEKYTWSILFLLPNNDSVAIALLGIYMLAILCVIAGFHTRLSLFIVWLLMTSFCFRNTYYWYNCDIFLRLYGFALLFSPAGARFSIDSWCKSGKDNSYLTKLYEPWAQRIIQIHIAAVYFKAFWGKLCTSSWWDGTAVYYATHGYGGCWLRYSLPYILDDFWTIHLLTWGTLAIEFSLWSLIWFRQFRYRVLLAGLALHIGIHWCLNLDILELVVLASYVNFIYPTDIDRVLSYARNKITLFVQHVPREVF